MKKGRVYSENGVIVWNAEERPAPPKWDKDGYCKTCHGYRDTCKCNKALKAWQDECVVVDNIFIDKSGMMWFKHREISPSPGQIVFIKGKTIVKLG